MKDKTIYKLLIAIPIVFFIIIFLVISILVVMRIDDYNALKTLDTGYSDNGNITLNGNYYPIDLDFCFDSEKYHFKGINTDKSYHIETSRNIILAVLRDYAVYESIDDPYGYIITMETNSFGFHATYYSDNMIEPNYNQNNIRQILIVFAPLQYPSSGYTKSISEKETISNIFDCIETGEDIDNLLINCGIEMLNNNYTIWVDYSDFPMYQLIYSNII